MACDFYITTVGADSTHYQRAIIYMDSLEFYLIRGTDTLSRRLCRFDPYFAELQLSCGDWVKPVRDWDGEVYADQFWRHYSFGNVKDRPFSKIWMDSSEPLMGKLKEKKKHVKGRCATCSWLDVCGGNFRVRAEAVSGDVWAPDPACYLTDEEIALSYGAPSCE